MTDSAKASPTAGPTLMLAATQPEASPVATALGMTMKSPQLFTPDWLLIQAGIGAQRMVAALNKSVRQKQVSRVIHFGYAGGLSPTLEPGHMPEFTTIAEPSGRLIAIDQPIPRVLGRDETPPPGPRLLSVPYLIHRPQDKHRLFKFHHAIAVDMESFAIAQACAQLQLPYACVRAISDPADLLLPPGAESWLDHEGYIRHARVIGFLLTHPKWISRVMNLGNNSKVASAMLTRKVVELLHKKLPVPTPTHPGVSIVAMSSAAAVATTMAPESHDHDEHDGYDEHEDTEDFVPAELD